MNPKSVVLTTRPRLSQLIINVYQAVCEGCLILSRCSKADNLNVKFYFTSDEKCY